MLVELIRSIMSPYTVSSETNATANQHNTLKQATFDAHVSYKSFQYLTLQELPKIGEILSPNHLLRREQSKLYKR
jgi:hypothetical protein